MLTGRYQFKPDWLGYIRLWVEDHTVRGFIWRLAKTSDLSELEPAIADGWRFTSERHGTLTHDGKRIFNKK